MLHHLDTVVSNIRVLCTKYNLDIRAIHISGVANWLADALSRLRLAAYTSDWLLNRADFLRWEKSFGPHTIDAMAAADGSNSQLPKWWSAPNDFFRQSLRDHNIWLNVAFSLAGPALKHIIAQRRLHGAQRVKATVIVPYQPPMSWWYLYAHHADVAHVYKAGENIFSAFRADSKTENAPRSLLGPCPFDVAVLRFD